MVKEADCGWRPEVPSINAHSSQEEKLDGWSLECTILEQNGEDQRWRKGHPVGSKWWIEAMVPKCDICWDLETELKLSAPCLPFHILLTITQAGFAWGVFILFLHSCLSEKLLWMARARVMGLHIVKGFVCLPMSAWFPGKQGLLGHWKKAPLRRQSTLGNPVPEVSWWPAPVWEAKVLI